MPRTPQPDQPSIDFDKDRHRSLPDAISAARGHEDFPTGPVEKFELICHASGEVTWRAWAPRAD